MVGQTSPWTHISVDERIIVACQGINATNFTTSSTGHFKIKVQDNYIVNQILKEKTLSATKKLFG